MSYIDRFCVLREGDMNYDHEGDWCKYEDHLVVVEKLKDEIADLKFELEVANDGLREIGEYD